MATYSAGERTEARLLDMACTLFFRDGYTVTHCNTIAKAAGVNPGLVHYHFETKGNLAYAVYRRALSGFIDQLENLFPDEDFCTKTALETRLYWYLIVNCAEFRRFLCEISNERIPLNLASDEFGREYFGRIIEMASDDAAQSPELLALYLRCSVAMDTEMTIAFAENPEAYAEKTMADMDIKMEFELLSVSPDQTDFALKRSEELFKMTTVEVLDDFEVKLSMES